MKQDLYKYGQIDCSTARNLYMYSSFDGEEFLDQYIFSRNLALEKIAKGFFVTEDSQCVDMKISLPSLDSKICETAKVIDALTRNLDSNKYEPYLTFFLRKFEVTHKILNQYDKEKNAVIENEVDLLAYVQLAFLLARELEKKISLKFLNCLLKLNDKIIYMLKNLDWNVNQEKFYVYHSIKAELKCIQELKKKCCI